MSDDFQTTHWSLVRNAGRGSTPAARQALETLCQRYWYPVYVYVRRRVRDVNEAQDLTQAFFANLLEKQSLAVADPARGRFRAFLLTACRNFISKERQRSRAQKRGGGCVTLSLDFAAAESKCTWEPGSNVSAEAVYHRQWAVTLLDSILEQLRQEARAQDTLRQYDELKPFVIGDRGDHSYAEAAARLGISTAAARMAASRLRKRYRQLLREAIADTVSDSAAVDDEIHNLFSAFSL